MPLVGSALVTLGLDAGGLMSGLTAAQGAISHFGSGVGAIAGIGTGLAVAGVAAVGLGVAAVHAAADFQSGLNSLVTGAGESASNIKLVGAGILDLASSTGTSTQQLTAGMYQIESAGYHGAAGLTILKAAAQGAKVGNADLGTVANGVTTIMTDFAGKNMTAAAATNTLIATVASGKTTMQDLSGALANILPTASSVHVSLNDVMGAMATMTGEGVPAADAATYLRQTLMSLAAPSGGTVKALSGIGLTSKQVSDEMKKSLPGALQMITDAVGKKFPVGSQGYISALQGIAGGSKQMQGMLDLTGTHLATFQGNVGHVAGAVKNGGNSITGWQQVQGSFNQKMSQASQSVNGLFIKVGTALLPKMTELAGKIGPLVDRFSSWLTKSGALKNITDGLSNVVGTLVTGIGNLATGLGNVIGFFQQNQVAADALGGILAGVGIGVLAFAATSIPALVAGFATWAAGAWIAAAGTLAAAAPFILIGAIAAGVILGIILAVQHWGQIVDWLKGVWGAISGWFSGLLSGIGQFFKKWGLTILEVIAGPVGWIILFWKPITAFFQNLWAGITAVFGKVGQWFKDRFTEAWNNITSVFAHIGQKLMAFWNTEVKGWQMIGQWFKDRFQEAWNNVTDVFQHIGQFLFNLWTNEVQGWQIIGAWFHDRFTEAWNNVTDVFQHIGQFLFNLWTNEVQGWQIIGAWFHDRFTEAWNNVTNIFAHIGQFLFGLWTREVQGWQNIGGWFRSRFQEAWNNVTSIFGNIGDWFHQKWENVVSGFKSVFGGLKDFASNVFGGVTGAVKAAFNNVIGLINNVIEHIDSIKVAGFGVSIPEIPFLARGGRNLGGGLYVVGDAGPEVLQLPGGSSVYPMTGSTPSVTPASYSGGSNGNQPVNLFIDSRQFARLMTDAFGNAVLSGVRSTGNPRGGLI